MRICRYLQDGRESVGYFFDSHVVPMVLQLNCTGMRHMRRLN